MTQHNSDGAGLTNNGTQANGQAAGAGALIDLEMWPERRLIRPYGSFRHVDFHVKVQSQSAPEPRERPAVAIGLVLDRSGSMHGTKITTARQAAIAVLDRLDQRDRIAAVVFDDRIDVLQHAAPATAELRARLRTELSRVEARGSTALHEGWLTGCNAIAAEHIDTADRLTRCFLLTDGLANVGITDTERIASDAADVRANAGVGTSTFRIGLDYNEALLGPMAVAGGGQFHHLRSPAEIATTFLGELGELLAVAVRDVRLEIQGAPGTTAEMISPYWMQTLPESSWTWAATLGDLIGGEYRHVVVRFGFMNQAGQSGPLVRARLSWTDASGVRAATAWQQVVFAHADDAARRAEVVRLDVQQVIGVQHAERAQRLAVERSRNGDVAGAREVLQAVARRIAAYAGDDAELRAAVAQLEQAAADLDRHGYAAASAKEAYFASQARSRGQRDLRAPQ